MRRGKKMTANTINTTVKARRALSEALRPLLGDGEADLPFGLSRMRMEVNLFSLRDDWREPRGTQTQRDHARDVIQHIIDAKLATGPSIDQRQRR